MAAFTERVNATLPLDEPDYILLTLVQGHAERACGMGCPGGQALTDGGKCVPRAVLAHRRDAQPSQAAPVRSATVETRAKQPPQTQSQAPAKVASAWSTVVTAPPAQLSDTPARLATPPLPGRMAIGAPTDAADGTTERAAIEGTSRKGALAAAATLAMQRDAEAENERKKRLAEAQARKSRELALLQASAANASKNSTNPAAATSAKQPVAVAAVAPPAVPSTSPVADPADEPTVGAPARSAQRVPLQRELRKASETAQPAPRIAAAPIRVPAPRLPPPYGVGRIVTAAPQPTYAPQPMRWSRTIFNDITRMR
jgi:hypothetical protein